MEFTVSICQKVYIQPISNHMNKLYAEWDMIIQSERCLFNRFYLFTILICSTVRKYLTLKLSRALTHMSLTETEILRAYCISDSFVRYIILVCISYTFCNVECRRLCFSFWEFLYKYTSSSSFLIFEHTIYKIERDDEHSNANL